MAKGRSREEALEEVTAEIKYKMTVPNDIYIPSVGSDSVSIGVSYPEVSTSWTYFDTSSSDFNVCDGVATYTMNTGERISWDVSDDPKFGISTGQCEDSSNIS
jgi:NADH:ubiquinone oxidoreductase subunit B-like Fe-S oxidoreductase